MSDPLVSIIMPSRNYGSWIESSIKSILKQDYTNIELIIIDNKSSDNTYQVINDYMEKDKRIIFYKIPGEVSNMTILLNKGIELSKGDFIARQDADDISHPQRISKQVAIIKQDPLILLGSLYYVLMPNGTVCADANNIYNIPISINDNMPPPLHGTWLFSKALIDKIGIYDERFPYAQDYEFYYRLLFKERLRAYVLEDHLYTWRMHYNNISLRNGVERNEFIVKAKKMYGW